MSAEDINPHVDALASQAITEAWPSTVKADTPAPASVSDMTNEEMFGTLTGYDEIAIAKALGAEVGTLARDKPTMFLRALVFVHLRRGGMTDTEAKAEALSMTIKAAGAYFAEDTEVDAEEPVTPSGEDN